MWLTRFFVLLSGLLVMCAAQERFETGELEGFTKSPTEHIIDRLEKPITTRLVSGVILAKTDSRPLADAVFEVRGPGATGKVQGVKSDREGRFRFKHLPPGKYVFKVTRDGFQSVIGRLTVSKTTAGEPMRIELAVGV